MFQCRDSTGLDGGRVGVELAARVGTLKVFDFVLIVTCAPRNDVSKVSIRSEDGRRVRPNEPLIE